MAYQQVKNFNPAKMGTQKGWCLQNCRLGFGITTGKYASAKADMNAQKANGTFHTGAVPTNVAVPVYCDTVSQYEHVVVADHGVWYSDGKKVTPTTFKVFGWGECCDGQRVVKWVADPTPAPTQGFLPPKGYWTKGDKDPRVGELARFMRNTFPAYTNVKALGNLYGDYLMSSIRTFQRKTGLVADANCGPKTYAMLKKYGFKA